MTKIPEQINTKKEKLTLANGFSPWSKGSIVLMPVVEDSCLPHGSQRTEIDKKGPGTRYILQRHGPCFFFLFLLFICSYNVWVIFPPFPPVSPPHLIPLPPTSSLPGRNYFALISNFVEERV
jgi:hypothetical protein